MARITLDDLYGTKVGYSAGDFGALLESYGYEHVRPGRHGEIFRSAELMEHPDLEVRRTLAYIQLPRSPENVEYVAKGVIASIEALLEWRQVRDAQDDR